MHDRALMADLLREIEELVQREGAIRASRIAVRLGALAHMTAEHFAGHFADASIGTAAEGATVDRHAETDTGAPGAQGIRLCSVELEYPP
jgi:hydrogenase nickel incorporation protein HypA/HybF